MSHRVTSSPAFRDLLRTVKVFDKLGWKCEANATESSGYYGKKRFPFVARNPSPGGYDIGLEIGKKGEVEMQHESMLHLDDFFGKNLSLLKQEYTKQTLLDETDSRMGSCEFTANADGTIGVEIEVEMLL